MYLQLHLTRLSLDSGLPLTLSPASSACVPAPPLPMLVPGLTATAFAVHLLEIHWAVATAAAVDARMHLALVNAVAVVSLHHPALGSLLH